MKPENRGLKPRMQEYRGQGLPNLTLAYPYTLTPSQRLQSDCVSSKIPEIKPKLSNNCLFGWTQDRKHNRIQHDSHDSVVV